jgi:eukaryotic-like serine/threonine-protein kinase
MKPSGRALYLLTACILFSAFLACAQRAPASQEVQLALVDREGRRTPVGPIPQATFAPRISPDGKEVVFDTQDDGSLWIAKLSDVKAKRRLTTEGSNRGPLWSGDGKRILYITDDGGAEALFWRLADGTGRPELLSKPVRAPESWDPRAPGLSFITLNPGGDYDVWTYSISDKKRVLFYGIPGSAQHSSHFSPDGRWIAYVSAETGRLEVYVRPSTGSGNVVRVSNAGGGHPLWAPDQKQLYFDNNGQMFAAEISTQPTFKAEKPAALPITGFIQGPLRREYDLMPDGKQFLMMFPPGR